MKCKVCGANNEDYLEYCENCAAPLNESAGAADDTGGASREERSWGFVASPNWSKPDFSANTVSEQDIPSDFQPQTFRPRYNSVQQTSPAQNTKRNSVRTYAKPAVDSVCPTCGAAIGSGQRFCNECGQKIDGGAPSAVPAAVQSAAAPVTPVPMAAEGGSASSGAASNIKYADPIDDDMFSFNYDDEEDHSAKKANARKASKTSAARPKGNSKRSRKRGGLALDKTLVFWVAAAVLVIALVAMAIFLLTKTSGGISGLFGGIFSSSAVTKEPTIEKTTTENGDPAYNITVYAKRNSIVRFEGGAIKNETPVNSSKPIILSVPEAVWIPSEPVEGDKLEIYPNITIVAKDGTETPLTFTEPIIINIPTLNLSVTAPNTPSFDTATPDVTISGVVDDPTSVVYVNDMQLTVDESGNFEGAYTLSAEGESTINVEARKNGYAIARQSFTVNYTTAAAATGNTAGTTPTGGTTGGSTTPATAGTMPTGATAVGYATTADLKVRSQPNASGEDTVLGKLALNQKVYIVEKDAGNSWAKVLYNGSEAYISNLYINVVDNYTVKDATVNTDKLKGRASGSSSGEVVTEFPLNTKVSYIKDVGSGWSLIEYDGKILFAATNYLTVS
ncbi:MAG: SH3 domain-containing protein [Candidatus Pelethousia sp.]|nr:SH3 domain-containing protein [Candidatus Pelethousia sp.]